MSTAFGTAPMAVTADTRVAIADFASVVSLARAIDNSGISDITDVREVNNECDCDIEGVCGLVDINDVRDANSECD